MRLTHLLGACSLWRRPLSRRPQPMPRAGRNSSSSGVSSAAIHKPAGGPAPHIAILVTHRTANKLNNIACREMASRGFLGVCFNTRFINNEAAVRSEEIMLDVKAAVDFAKSQPGHHQGDPPRPQRRLAGDEPLSGDRGERRSSTARSPSG